MQTAADFLKPDVIRRLGRLDLRARYMVEGFLSGLHLSRRRGRSTEFSEHRSFAWGDDPKDIDWRLFARTEKLFVKQYRAETDMRVGVVVDSSASMHYASKRGTMSKADYAAAITAAVGYMALGQGDRIGLTLVDERVRIHMPPKCRRLHYFAMLEELTRARGGPPVDFPGVSGKCADLCRRHGLLIVLSDFLAPAGEVIEGFRRLRSRGAHLIALQVLDPAEHELSFRGPVVLEDPETGRRLYTHADRARRAYLARLRTHTEQLRRAAAEIRIDFHLLNTETPFDRALGTFFAYRRKRY